jgi:3-oxoadipate enol-lactonase
MKIKANGISINTEISGRDGAPWLIFSNSLATDLHMWDRTAQDQGSTHRVLRYDQRGHGGTEATPGRYTFELLIADIVGVMDALGIGKASWCGISMGGATGMGAVQQYPDRFDRLAICDTTGQSTPASSQQWEARIVNARTNGMQAEVESTIGRWFPPETVQANPPHLDALRKMIRETPVDGFCGCSAALANHDYRTGMKTVTNPVLYMCGEKDGNNTAVMRAMKDELPASKYVELPGAGHISNMDRPELFSKALREFLA